MEIKAPRGVRDILPDESWKWAFVLKTATGTMADYGFSEVHLPLFEHTELFARGVGDTTDIVEKEMYTFLDRGERSITLRPEATSGMVRAALENGLCAQNSMARLWCWGPMFRYDRPQKGRYRQFHQIDAEFLGTRSPIADVEIIDMSAELFRRLGLKNLEVVLNSVGCPKCRPAYREALLGYFNARRGELCETCLGRLERNPLRILDCKNPGCSAVAEGVPAIYDSLCNECRQHFQEVCNGLERLGLACRLDKRLVRGLDYYTKTAYEILSGDLGAQNAVCGGGRYDDLAETIGGPPLPGVGFATGLERIILVMEEQGCGFGRAPGLKAWVVAVDDASRNSAQILVHALRTHGISAEQDVAGRSFKAQMKAAGASGASWACIIGPEELESGSVSLKNMSDGGQVSLPFGSVPDFIGGRQG